MSTPTVVVQGKLQNPVGVAELGAVILRLQGYGQQVPRIPAAIMLGRTDAGTIAIAADGTWLANVWPNDVITPPNTYYTLEVRDSNGTTIQVQAYRFYAGQGPYDLTSFPPFDPTGGLVAPIPANQLVVVPWTPAPQMDGTLGLTFELTLAGDTLAPALTNPVPGNLYTVMLHQGTPVAWQWVPPATWINASPASPLPGSTTIQTFLCRSNQTLVAIAPAVVLAAGQ